VTLTPLSLGGLIVLGVGVLMALTGLMMYVFDWQTARARKRNEAPRVEAQSLEGVLKALTPLVNALKGASQGMQLVVLSIPFLVIGGALLGVGGI
jgi:hypothetical protein